MTLVLRMRAVIWHAVRAKDELAGRPGRFLGLCDAHQRFQDQEDQPASTVDSCHHWHFAWHYLQCRHPLERRVGERSASLHWDELLMWPLDQDLERMMCC